ncbi:MAG TPA: L-seryl-tRNA(Sec) selenium transferase [Bacillota bacterium]|nr:L-seryl-tRNA(Sec) selenium transferase [Bacillota bacterium]
MSEDSGKHGLRFLPSVDEVLRDGRLTEFFEHYPRGLVVQAVREAISEERGRILSGQTPEGDKTTFLNLILSRTSEKVPLMARPNLRRVINATGVVLHTNLGRALLSDRARAAVNEVASNYSNLELDLETGGRGSRYAAVEELLCTLTGAEAAMAVNNNAAAVLLALGTVARGREVIVSRGQLVEIGGSFRIPEVMARSGAHLVEVGTTNKTYPEDYRRAVSQNTALLLHVHTSNYRIIGFARETTVSELVEIGRDFGIPVMSDLGSGFLIDLSRYGLPYEPTVQEAVSAGPDIVTFSGDKLLGGPQAGVIVGKRHYIEKMKKNPLTRALRIDKMTVAALEATLREYLDAEKAMKDIPTLEMLTLPQEVLFERALRLVEIINILRERADIEIEKGVSAVGGGAMPTAVLPTAVVSVRPKGISAGQLQSLLRRGEPPVMGRVQDDRLYLDVRTVKDEEIPALADAIMKAFNSC